MTLDNPRRFRYLLCAGGGPSPTQPINPASL